MPPRVSTDTEEDGLVEEPTVEDFAAELDAACDGIATVAPETAARLRRRVALLQKAPRRAGGVSWLAKCGDPAARLAAEAYSGPPSGLRRRAG